MERSFCPCLICFPFTVPLDPSLEVLDTIRTTLYSYAYSQIAPLIQSEPAFPFLPAAPALANPQGKKEETPANFFQNFIQKLVDDSMNLCS